MAGVLLDQVEQDPLQGRGVRAVPALTGLAHLVEVMGGDDGAAAFGLVAEVSEERGGCFFVSGGPAIAIAVGPGVTHVAAFETPLKPAPLNVAQVLEQLQGRPARRQPGATPLGRGQRLELAGHPGAEIVQVAQEDLGARIRRDGRREKRLRHAAPPWTASSRAIIP
jgi:hypothetical protein